MYYTPYSEMHCCSLNHDVRACSGDWVLGSGTRRDRGFVVNPLAMSASELEDLQRQSGLVGEDAAVFSFEEQRLKSWGAFLAVLGTVLTALYYLWLNPDTGFGETSVMSAGRLCRRSFHVAHTFVLG